MQVGLIIALTVALLSAYSLKGLRYRVPCQTKQGQLLHWPGKKLSSTVTLQQEQTIYNTDVRTVTRFCDESVRISFCFNIPQVPN